MHRNGMKERGERGRREGERERGERGRRGERGERGEAERRRGIKEGEKELMINRMTKQHTCG